MDFPLLCQFPASQLESSPNTYDPKTNRSDCSVDFSRSCCVFAQKAKELIQTPALFTVAFKEEALLNEALPIARIISVPTQVAGKFSGT